MGSVVSVIHPTKMMPEIVIMEENEFVRYVHMRTVSANNIFAHSVLCNSFFIYQFL